MPSTFYFTNSFASTHKKHCFSHFEESLRALCFLNYCQVSLVFFPQKFIHLLQKETTLGFSVQPLTPHSTIFSLSLAIWRECSTVLIIHLPAYHYFYLFVYLLLQSPTRVPVSTFTHLQDTLSKETKVRLENHLYPLLSPVTGLLLPMYGIPWSLDLRTLLHNCPLPYFLIINI